MPRILRKLALFALIAAVPATASANVYRFELTPFVGYRFGGTLSGSDTDLFVGDLETNDSGAFGVAFDIPLSSEFQLELLASNQQTDLRVDEGLFGSTFEVADIDVAYYHIGFLWQGGSGQVSPFFVASAGVTALNPDVPGASTENRFSVSVGGGVKIFFNSHIGMRFEGRGFWTAIDDEEDRYYHYDYTYDNDFYQGQALAGLIFSW